LVEKRDGGWVGFRHRIYRINRIEGRGKRGMREEEVFVMG
jgi:hypothetical protein